MDNAGHFWCVHQLKLSLKLFYHRVSFGAVEYGVGVDVFCPLSFKILLFFFIFFFIETLRLAFTL